MIIRDWCLLIAVAVMLGSIVAHAEPVDAKLTWTVPTTREDGSKLNTNELASYTIKWGLVSGTYTDSVTIKADQPQPYVWAQDMKPPVNGGTRVYFAIVATDTKGRPSKDSNEASKRFVHVSNDPPAAPGKFKVTQ